MNDTPTDHYITIHAYVHQINAVLTCSIAAYRDIVDNAILGDLVMVSNSSLIPNNKF
jgi:hypothetical protein